MILPVQDTNCINCGQLHIFLLLDHALDICGFIVLIRVTTTVLPNSTAIGICIFSGMRTERKKESAIF